MLCKGEIIHTSTKTGIIALLESLSGRNDLEGYSAADKIIGKAAAMLFVLGGIKAAYSPVMSKSAVSVFMRYGVNIEYDSLVACIINHKGTGQCPIEQVVSCIDDAAQVLKVLRNHDYIKR